MGQEEQAVIVRTMLPPIGSDELFDQISALEDQLAEAINSACAGEFDGNEVGQGELKLYMYGPDADKLLSSVEIVLRRNPLMRTAIATVRYGPPGASSREVSLRF